MTGMEVWMRRSDRELKDMADIVATAKRETVRTVAFHDESCPYLIPLNYGAEVEEGKLVLYFHGAKEGTKIDKIRENPQVSYCIYGKNSLKIDYDAACKSTTSFESICGNGTAYFVEDLTSKKKALASLMNQMSQKKAFEENSFAEAMVNAVTVWKIVTENVTGKRHEYHEGRVCARTEAHVGQRGKRAGNVSARF